MFLMHIVNTNQLQANDVQKQGLQSHHITHYLQLLGASPQTSTGALPLDSAGDFRPPDSLVCHYTPVTKF